MRAVAPERTTLPGPTQPLPQLDFSSVGSAPPVPLDSRLSRGWARILVPSLSDLLLLALLFWLLLRGGAVWNTLLLDGDTGWHIRTGEYILANRAVPHQDLYSFSKPGDPWFAWEWLADVLSAVAYQLAGLKGVVLFAAVILAAVGTLLLRHMIWRGANMFVALVLCLLAFSASSIHFLARPHIFTMLLLAISMWVAERDRRGRTAMLWLLIPLTAVWTNLHGGFLAWIACLGLLVIGSAIEAWLWPEPGQARWGQTLRYAMLLAACSAASLVNPYGLELHRHIIQYLRSDWIRNAVQEFQAPGFTSESQLQFEALLFLGLLAVGSFVRRKQITEALWILYFAHLALGTTRHVPIFVIVATPLIASEVSAWFSVWTATVSPRSLVGILDQMAKDLCSGFRRTSPWPALILLGLAVPWLSLPWPKDFPEPTFPVSMVHRHAAELRGARVFTRDQWADYLLYLYYPSQRVFLDGRSDFYGPKLGNDYIHLIQGQSDWKTILTRESFDATLAPLEWPLVTLLKHDPAWKVVEEDGHAILFRRSNR